MRLIKKTVNQDDTTAYHLFFGEERGKPGTELNFFDFPGICPAKEGVSSISGPSFRVASDNALQFWKERFTEICRQAFTHNRNCWPQCDFLRGSGMQQLSVWCHN
jgi:catechol 2,3-dioxygenase-like lactoylglutathione lyase family enzyme